MSKPVEIVTCEITGTTLRETMDAAGLSQEETARRAGTTLRQIGRLMYLENQPSLSMAYRLSVVLKKPIEKLFTFEVETRAALNDSNNKKRKRA